MKIVNACSIIVIIFSLKLFTQFTGGNGTSGSPYQITTPAQLIEVRNYLSSY